MKNSRYKRKKENKVKKGRGSEKKRKKEERIEMLKAKCAIYCLI